MNSFKDMVQQFLEAVKTMCPGAKAVLCSILPSDDIEVRECASDMNKLLRSFTQESDIAVYVDTASRFIEWYNDRAPS